jgi:hypothetical protein
LSCFAGFEVRLGFDVSPSGWAEDSSRSSSPEFIAVPVPPEPTPRTMVRVSVATEETLKISPVRVFWTRSY